MGKESAIKLFKFLKELSDLKTRKIFDVNSFEKVLWLNEIPNEKECYSITHELASGPSNFDKWIELRKPKVREHPEPSSELEEWVKEETLKNYHAKPELYGYIFQENLGDNGEVYEEKIFLENNLEIRNAFTKYYEDQWQPWANERIRLEPVLKVYNTLFEIYHKNKTQGESFQVVLGLGFLSTKTRKDKFVRRHIVTTPLSINFNPTTGTITVGPGEQNAELSLELDMFETSERPDISDQINTNLGELNNDFWTSEDFYNCLSSWVNRYDPESQFRKDLGLDNVGKSFTTLSISPAIIFRSRGERVFSRFYSEAISDLESDGQINTCLEFVTNKEQSIEDTRDHMGADGLPQLPSDKYYSPLPVNEEQRSIITKLSNSIGVLVQGPPGTGKTHSIANLICHLLAIGKKVLITSQTDRALKVLKNKLPDDVKSLCVEVLGQDQKSLLELKNSVNSINSRYQEWDGPKSKAEIDRLEKKDNDLKSSLIELERRIVEIKDFETRLYENLFGNYSGTAARIATQVKSDEDEYSWITEHFTVDSNIDSPITNEEAILLLKSLRKLKNTPDSVLDEPLEFLDKVLTLSEYKEKIIAEENAGQIIERYEIEEDAIVRSAYSYFSDQDFENFFRLLSALVVKSEKLINSEQDWIKQAKVDCITDRDRPWRHLFDTTNEILESNKDVLLSVDRTKISNTPESLDFVELSATINDFLKKYNHIDKVSWGLFCSKEVRKLKRVIKETKIDGRKCCSYQEVLRLSEWTTANLVKEKLSNIWDDKLEIQSSNFGAIYHSYSDLCEPLEECLEVHKLVSELKKLLDEYPDIPHPKWRLDSLKEELKIAKVIDANKAKGKIEAEFENYISLLNLYRGQKNQIASKIIQAYQNRSIELFNEAVKHISDFINNKKEFQEISPIKRKIDSTKGTLFKALRENIDDPKWESRLVKFQSAWAWYRAKVWLKENGDSEFLKSLARQRDDLLESIQRNLELLVAKKAWGHCLSSISSQQQASLKGWAHAVSKIGKGTGKTAPKHRKVAKERMSECKGAIPAWIMPLYRVVENIKPGSELFDVAIIDEASQTGPEGLLLNYLAKKIIVVGDNEQISPEMPGVLDNDVEILKKKYLSDLKYSEHVGREYSYYDYCDICFTSQVQLREHFRCMPEIIQFSNNLSYSGKPLIPMRQYGSSRLQPLKNTFVEGAISKVGSAKNPQNDREAEAIVSQLRDCMYDPAYRDKTFGVISLQGALQIKRIETLLENELDKEMIEEREITVGDAYDFQGDERDVIFLSMAVSSDYNFTALTKSTYKKRYNVAASRAKDQMWLFHSVRADELSQHCFRRQLLTHCMSYENRITGWPQEELQKLYEKVKETKNKSPKNAPHPFDSWFEARVFLEIANRGFLVIPQLDVSNYRIDMVVIGTNGRLAVECDGDIYHAEEHEENDLNRQWELERCGWTFWRLRSSAFYLDQEEALKGLWEKLEKMKIYPLGHEDSPAKEVESPEYEADEVELPKHSIESSKTSKFDVTEISHIDPRDNSIEDIASGLLKIIEIEGPIVTSRLYRLYVRSCGIAKVGKQIKKKLNKAVWSLKNKGLIVFEKESSANGMHDEVFYLTNSIPVVIRQHTDRPIDEIPLGELKKVMKDLRERLPLSSDEEIFRATLEFYGLKRLTKVAQTRLENAVSYSK